MLPIKFSGHTIYQAVLLQAKSKSSSVQDKEESTESILKKAKVSTFILYMICMC